MKARPDTAPFFPSIFQQHLVGVLNDPDVFLTELLPVKRQQPVGDLGKAREFGLFVNVLLPIFFLEEVLGKRKKKKPKNKK